MPPEVAVAAERCPGGPCPALRLRAEWALWRLASRSSDPMPRSGDVLPARWAIQRRTGSPWAPRRVSFVVTPAHRASAGRSPTRPQVDPISASGFLRSGGCRLRVRANSGGNGGSTHDTHPRWQPGRRASPRCKEFGPASHAGRRASPRCKEFGPGGRHARGAQARSVHVSREPANGAAGHVRVGIDDEEGGAAVGAAIGTGGGRSPAAHAAHRDGATGHRGGGGSSHHGWVTSFLTGSHDPRALSALDRGTAAVLSGPLIGRLGVESRSGSLVPGPGRQGEPEWARPWDAATGDVPNHALSPRFSQPTRSGGADRQSSEAANRRPRTTVAVDVGSTIRSSGSCRTEVLR